MKIILSGGGTGGHIYPALSIINKVRQHHPQAEVLYIGSKNGLEADLVQQAGIPFQAVSVSGLRRRITLENVKTIYRFFNAVKRSKQIIKQFKPDLVIGTGGYVSAPVVYAAHRLKVPSLIHEQNVVPGLTNTLLGRYSDAIAVSFKGSTRFFRKRPAYFTGNPRASEVVQADGRRGRQQFGIDSTQTLILIVGGSRGAEAINRAFLELADHVKERPDCHFVYIPGQVHYETITKQMDNQILQLPNLTVKPFIYDLPDLLAATDIIVNRAGATFLAEITALGLPAVLIPSPYVTNNHQEKNARWLEHYGAGHVIMEKELTGEKLWQTIISLVDNPARRDTMKQASLKLGKPEAQDEIYNLILKLTGREPS